MEQEPDFLDSASDVREGEGLDLARLEAFLKSRFPEETGNLTVRQFPNGHSNLTYLLRLGNLEMALRRPPFGSTVKTAHDMSREFRVLSKLHDVFAPAPRPFFYCDDEKILGAPFYVMERIRGVILRRKLPPGLEIPPDVAGRMANSFIDQLAALHTIDYREIGLGDLGKPEGYIGRQVGGWIKRYRNARTHSLEGDEETAEWLLERMPATESGHALIHNDYKYDNVVLDPQDLSQVIGILDWEMCTLGDPLMDLGTVLNYWITANDPEELKEIRFGHTTLPGMPSRLQLAERYSEKSGFELENLPFYYAFGLYKTAVICQQIYERYHRGVTHDPRFPAFLNATRVLMKSARDVTRTGSV